MIRLRILKNWFAYLCLIVTVFGCIGLIYKGFSDRIYRYYLSSIGTQTTGQVVGHQLYRCYGIRCSTRVEFDGTHGTKAMEAFQDRCPSGRRYNCHTDLIVQFAFSDELIEIEAPVGAGEFKDIGLGSSLVVLVNSKDPSASILRDHNPQGFLFWIAVLMTGFLFFVGSAFLARKQSPRTGRFSDR